MKFSMSLCFSHSPEVEAAYIEYLEAKRRLQKLLDEEGMTVEQIPMPPTGIDGIDGATPGTCSQAD